MRITPNRGQLTRTYRRFVIRASWRLGGIPQVARAASGFVAALSAACALLLLASAPGCASTPEAPPPLTSEARATFGMVGVVSIGPAPAATVSGPVGVQNQVGQGMAKGGAIGGLSGAGTGAVLGLFAGPCAPIAVPLFAGMGAAGGLLLGAGTGAIVRGVNAIPTDAAMKIQASLASTIGTRDLQTDLRQRVLHQPGNGLVLIDLGTRAAEYAPFTTRDANTVVEIALTEIAFAGDGGSDPKVALFMLARVRVIRLSDNVVLWSSEEIAFSSEARDFSVWTADPALAPAEIERGLEAIAQGIAREVLIGTETPLPTAA